MLKSVILLVIGLGFFLSGFLLTKTEIRLRSEANDLEPVIEKSLGFHSNSSAHTALVQEIRFGDCTTCYHPTHVFIFVVDALRYDFFAFNKTIEDICASEGRSARHRSIHCGSFNKFENLNRLLYNNRTQCMLLRSFADPPTTTSQRLKALVTGTLPTFIELGKNFESPSIAEDNIIDQLLAAKKKIAFVGDDTWSKLLPGRFAFSQPLDSFNTKDLDYVDDTIEEHLNEVLANSSLANWDFYIAHFLGVDHIGHTHSAFHPLMGDRLTRMDSLAFKVISAMPPNSTFILLGDHGMTDEGEHGGGSDAETSSPVFIYRNSESSSSFLSPAGSGSSHDFAPDIDQIDITPTLAQLLGLPIPYSSLGTSVQQLLSSNMVWDESCSRASIARQLMNALQIVRYLETYQKNESFQFSHSTSSFTANILETLRSIMVEHAEYLVEDSDACLSIDEGASCKQTASCFALRDRYNYLFSQIKYFTRRQWTSFNIPLMLFGISVIAAAVFFLIVQSCVQLHIENRRENYDCFLLFISATFHLVSVFSNSFIIEEYHIHLFVLQSFLVCTVYSNIMSKKPLHRTLLLVIVIFILKISASSILGHIKDSESVNAVFGRTISVLIAVTLCVIPIGFLYLRFRFSRSLLGMLSAILFFISQILLGFYWRLFTYEIDELLLATDFRIADRNLLVNSALICSGFATVTSLISYYFNFETSAGLLLQLCASFYSIYCALSGPLMVLQSFVCSLPIIVAIVESSNDINSFNRIFGVLFFSSRFLYFLSGHKMTFSSLQLTAGMIGSSTFSFWRAGTFLIINTFGSDILSILFSTALISSRLKSNDAIRKYKATSILHKHLITVCNCLCIFILRR